MNNIIEIKQNASSIKLFLYYTELDGSKSSKAYSISEEILKKENNVFQVYYLFTNKPRILKEQLNNHEGFATIDFFHDKKIVGEYYNQRNNKGEFILNYEGKKLFGRFDK